MTARKPLDARTLRWAARVCQQSRRQAELCAADFGEVGFMETRARAEESRAMEADYLANRLLNEARAIQKRRTKKAGKR